MLTCQKEITGSWKHLKLPRSPVRNLSPQITFYSNTRGLSSSPSSRLSTPRSRCPTPPSRHSRVSEGEITLIPGLGKEGIGKIYISRCKDLKVSPNEVQKMRFHKICQKVIKTRHFNLKDQELGVSSGEVIGEILQRSCEFCRLTLSNNHLGDVGVVRLAESLSSNDNFIHIDISSNDLTVAGLAGFINCYLQNQSIVSFDFSSYNGLNRNKFGPEAADALSVLIKNSQVLQILQLNEVNLTDQGVEKVFQGLAHNKSLIKLSLINNYLTHKSFESYSEVLLSCQIQDLNLSQNKLADQGISIISKILSANDYSCTITKLDVSKNEISYKGGFKLFRSIRYNPFLTYLNLDDNNLSPKVGQSLHFLLLSNYSLTTLSLNSCQLKNEGINHLALGLSKNKKLLNLNLANNDYEDLSILTEALQENNILTNLNLSNNFIKDGNCIGKIIKFNSGLKALDLSENRIKDEFGIAILEGVKGNSSMIFINFEGNLLSVRFVQEIKQVLKRNHEKIAMEKSLKSKAEVKKLKVERKDLKMIEGEINKKQFEKVRIVNKIGKLREQLNSLKNTHDSILPDLQKEFHHLKEKNQFLTVELEILQKDINKQTLIVEKAQKDKQEKVYHINSDISALQEKCNRNVDESCKEKLKLQRLHYESSVYNLKASLESLQAYKKSVEATLAALTTGLQSTRSELYNTDMSTSPKRHKSPQPLTNSSQIPKRKDRSAGPPERRIFVFSPSTRIE